MQIIELFVKSLQYEFMQKALICGILISISASLIGIFLVLKKQSLLSDGLSHVSFASIAISLLAGVHPLFFSIPIVIIASFLINILIKKANLYSDSAIGLISTVSLAIGVIIISINKGFNIDIYSYLFGSILAINNIDIIFSLILFLTVFFIFLFFFNELYLITYDEDYAKISKINVNLINTIFETIQSVTIVIGIKIVGALLISSLIIFPVVSSLQIANSFKKLTFLTVTIATISTISGIILSFILNFPTGATIVVVNTLLFIIFYIFRTNR